jgi:transcriptional regulator with XRE-family HTH domain
MIEDVKSLRKSLKLTQQELAERLGVSQSRITMAESKGEMSDSLVEKIEQVFNIKVKPNKPEITTTSNDLAVQELIKEINFLRNQIDKKDNLIDALTEKFLKDEVTNWPPMSPLHNIGVSNHRLLRVA